MADNDSPFSAPPPQGNPFSPTPPPSPAPEPKKVTNESLVIGSKVKAYIQSKGLMCAGDLPNAVSDKVRELLDSAGVRTQANKRSTVRPADL